MTKLEPSNTAFSVDAVRATLAALPIPSMPAALATWIADRAYTDPIGPESLQAPTQPASTDVGR